jgi:nucleoside-diphosphate-sugar epimerase
MDNLIITGSKEGFGKYLHEELGGLGLTRENKKDIFKKVEKGGVETIIHCAHPRKREVSPDELIDYINDTLLFTQDLLKIPHKKFIFLSTVDVYPKNNKKHYEEETIDINAISGFYGLTKILSEELIKSKGKYLILRPSGLLGKYTRKNNLVKILDEKSPILSLSKNSEMNYVLYEDVLEFIKFSIKEKIEGTYNVCSNRKITIGNLAKKLKKEVIFGNFEYSVPKITNNKIKKIFPKFKKTSEEVILEYINLFKRV